jgi:hypothetical protein
MNKLLDKIVSTLDEITEVENEVAKELEVEFAYIKFEEDQEDIVKITNFNGNYEIDSKYAKY